MTTKTLASRRAATATFLLCLGGFLGCQTSAGPGSSFLEALNDPAAESAEAPATVPGAPDPEVQQAVSASLERYRSAYESRDLESLRDVWEMSSIDAFFLERAWQSCESQTVAVESTTMELAAGAVRVSFDQTVDYLCEGREAGNRRALQADLAMQSDGSWKIVRLTPRTAARGTVRAKSRAPVSATSAVPALDALHAYQSALQACDPQALAQTWVMSRRERDLFERFCQRSDNVSVSIEQQEVRLDGNRGEVQFAQTVTAERDGQFCETNATLRASLVRRESGHWSLWDLQQIQ